MWSRDMPREERIRSSRTPSTMASSTTSSLLSSRAGGSPNKNDGAAFTTTNFQNVATNALVFCDDKTKIDERTPIVAKKDVVARTPGEGLPRIKTKAVDYSSSSEEEKSRDRRLGWRDFCPGVVSIAIAFFLFSAANVAWKSGKSEKWYEHFRGHARYMGPATCFRDAKLSEGHCLPHFAIIGASTSTGRLKAALKEHPMIDSDAKAVHFWNTP